MIKIEQPQVVSSSDEARLETYVSINGKRSKIWFSVDKEYESYLCWERSDAYVIAVLNFAMRNGHDIECDAPLSEDLYYNLDKYLIDAIEQYNPNFYRPIIKAPISSDILPCAGAVGTGISCGVDSLHALASQSNLKFKQHNITHLTFNNVGSHGEGEKAQELFKDRLERPKKFAEEFGYKLVVSNSNLMDVIEQNHFKSHTYSSMFPVYCLQKLYSIYYYASAGYKYDEFTLIDKPSCSSGSYEMLSLPLLSTHNLRVYSEGEGMTRMTKLKKVVDYVPSYKYLNVCLMDGDNCGKCEKCVRTLLGIDALEKLESYSEVFDIEYYKTNKKWYLMQLLKQKAANKHDYFELYPYFKKEINWWMHLQVLTIKVIAMLPTSIKRSPLAKVVKSLLIK